MPLGIRRQIWISISFTDNFFVATEPDGFIYKTTECYAAQFERSQSGGDSTIDVEWLLHHLVGVPL